MELASVLTLQHAKAQRSLLGIADVVARYFYVILLGDPIMRNVHVNAQQQLRSSLIATPQYDRKQSKLDYRKYNFLYKSYY